MDLSERTRRLSLAGIELIAPWPLADDSVTPPDIAWSASACGPESGRVDRTFDDTDEERIAQANAAWLLLARQYGLFDAQGTFLLSVSQGDGEDLLPQWFRVRLSDRWDLFGIGAQEGVLGYGADVPAFVMHSADGGVLVAATAYETCFSIIVLPRPAESAVLQRSAKQWLEWAEPPAGQRLAAVRRWLARNTPMNATPQ